MEKSNLGSILLKAIAFLPAIITGVENIFGAGNGKSKASKTEEIFDLMLKMEDQLAVGAIKDIEKFKAGKQKVIDGIVEMKNASIWSKPQA